MNGLSLTISLFAFFACLSLTQAQENQIPLMNPSFEGKPRAGTIMGKVHSGWKDCGSSRESVPDVQPNSDANNPFFAVTTPPQHGDTYLGLVVRDNDTWEGLTQRLMRPIEDNKTYSFQIYLAKSPQYVSDARNEPGKKTNHDGNAKLQIWGGNMYCQRLELLAESPMIKHADWRAYEFLFRPNDTYNFITIRAFYKTPSLVIYNGNLLVDNASPITLITEPVVDIQKPSKTIEKTDDEQFTLFAKVDNVSRKKDIKLLYNSRPIPFTYSTKSGKLSANIKLLKGNNKIKITAKNKVGSSSDNATVVYEPKVIIASTSNPPVKTPEQPVKPKVSYENKEFEKDVKEGQVLLIEKLYFDIDSASINAPSRPVLDEVYEFIRSKPNVVFEIGGHTNNRCATTFCDKLSERRAESVVDYLVKKGIDRNRLRYKGYGKRNPVATNNTITGRKRNQRVEIKVLSLDG